MPLWSVISCISSIGVHYHDYQRPLNVPPHNENREQKVENTEVTSQNNGNDQRNEGNHDCTFLL